METLTRTCLLTGASGALGRAFIERFGGEMTIAAVHYEHVVWSSTQDQIWVDPLAPEAELALNDNPVLAIHADLSSREECSRVIEVVRDTFGRLDLLVNAAALRSWKSLFANDSLSEDARVMELNVLAPLRLAAAATSQLWHDVDGNLRANRNVINISSTAGLFVYPDLGQTLYASSKAALNHATYHLASELWDIGVRANAVAPNTFPGRVDIEEVLDAVESFDSGDETGAVRQVGAT